MPKFATLSRPTANFGTFRGPTFYWLIFMTFRNAWEPCVTHILSTLFCVPISLDKHSAWSESRRTSKMRKTGAWCVCNARKAMPAGLSPHMGCVFVQRRRKSRMARPEGPSQFFGYCSFVEERRSSGEACGAEPTSPFLVASDQKRHLLLP